MPITPDISRKLLELKEECGLTFKQIGEEVGSSEANVRRYIMGETKVPDRQLLYAIIRVLESTPEEVLSKKKPEPQQPEQKPQTAVDFSLLERQEQRHKEHMAQWTEHHKEQIEHLKSSHESAIKAKDERIAELKREKQSLRIAVIALAAITGLFVLFYLIPDILNGDWGHIIYDVAMRYR